MRYKQNCFQSGVFLLTPWAVLGQGAVQDQLWGAVGWDRWMHLLSMDSEEGKKCCF